MVHFPVQYTDHQKSQNSSKIVHFFTIFPIKCAQKFNLSLKAKQTGHFAEPKLDFR